MALKNSTYKELQDIAKKLGVKANLSKEKLIIEIQKVEAAKIELPLEQMPYRNLQIRAKSLDVKANQVRTDLIIQIKQTEGIKRHGRKRNTRSEKTPADIIRDNNAAAGLAACGRL